MTKVYGPFKKIFDEIKDTFEYRLETLSLEITEKILEIMENKGMNRNDLAKKMGVSRASVTQFLNEGSNITIKRLLRISDALDCDIDIQIVEKAGSRNAKSIITGKYDPSYPHNYSNVIILDDYRRVAGDESVCG